MFNRATIKEFLGDLPLTAEIYWFLRQAGKPIDSHFTLERLKDQLPTWKEQARAAREGTQPGKRVMIFGTLHYWIEQTALMGFALSGLGHDVFLSYLPYDNWTKPLSRFDLRRQNAYARSVLSQAEPLLQIVSLVDLPADNQSLPTDLRSKIEAVAYRDYQYSLQVEEVDRESELYQMRLRRNMAAAQAALTWMNKNQPQVVIIPNGSILEFGALYETARFLEIPAVTFEFGEQNHRIWIAQDAEVMHQETDKLWKSCRKRQPTQEQREQLRDMFASRQHGQLWDNFARRWQGVPSAGGDQTRTKLSLDARPIVLMATNVVGDSLTLGREIFSASMSEWIKRTARHFSDRSDVQFVVRIHPGESFIEGPSVIDVVREAVPDLPEHIHLIPADAQINTYDLMEIADLGLVYTTTVGLEMAMGGLPVIVSGQTHYRDKGFTHDPGSWDAYFEILDQILARPQKYPLTKEQVDLAWHYAYCFFFEVPHPFPWHLLHYWKELDDWPLARILSSEGQEIFGNTFKVLAGEPVG
jgi:hypothetical protein